MGICSGISKPTSTEWKCFYRNSGIGSNKKIGIMLRSFTNNFASILTRHLGVDHIQVMGRVPAGTLGCLQLDLEWTIVDTNVARNHYLLGEMSASLLFVKSIVP